jgi:hypothetical protein
MKKTLLSITALRLLTSMVFPQSKVIINNLSNMVIKCLRELMTRPYTGKVFAIKSNGNKKVARLYRKGINKRKKDLLHGDW